MEQREEEAYQPLTEDGQSSTGAGWRAWCGHRGKARACGRVLREKPQTLVLLVMLTLVLVVVGVVALFSGFDDKPCTPCRGTVSCCSARVVITRHGEKPKSGDGLSRDGSHRAQYLQHCCVANRSHALALGAPTVVVAPTVRDGKSHRGE
jgi:hypothetical protein